MEAFPAGMDGNPNEGLGNSLLKAAICLAINGGKKSMDNNRATISCNNGIISLQDTFMLSGTNKGI